MTLNYYSKFIPNCSIVLSPLYSLLQKNARWTWSSREIDCFKQAKELLTSPRLLVHFNPTKKLLLSSSYGIGAVLTHQMEDGTEQPIVLYPQLSFLLKRSIHNSIKRLSQLSLESLISTNTYMVTISLFTLTIIC